MSGGDEGREGCGTESRARLSRLVTLLRQERWANSATGSSHSDSSVPDAALAQVGALVVERHLSNGIPAARSRGGRDG
jgi:hypothetical protein